MPPTTRPASTVKARRKVWASSRAKPWPQSPVPAPSRAAPGELEREEVRQRVGLGRKPAWRSSAASLSPLARAHRDEERARAQQREAERERTSRRLLPGARRRPEPEAERLGARHPEAAVEVERAAQLPEHHQPQHAEQRRAHRDAAEHRRQRRGRHALRPPRGDGARDQDPGHDEPGAPAQQREPALGAEEDVDGLGAR